MLPLIVLQSLYNGYTTAYYGYIVLRALLAGNALQYYGRLTSYHCRIRINDNMKVDLGILLEFLEG